MPLLPLKCICALCKSMNHLCFLMCVMGTQSTLGGFKGPHYTENDMNGDYSPHIFGVIIKTTLGFCTDALKEA